MKNTEKEYIKLDSFLKLQGAADTGGQAKIMIQNGEVMVNGVQETRRGKKLYPDDVVEVNGKKYTVK